MWASSPHHSWSTTTPGPSPSGSARYPVAVPPFASNSTSGIWSALLVFSVGLAQLLGERPSYGDADHHSHPGLLRDERSNCAQALGLVVRRDGLADLLLVRLVEPPTGGQGLGEDALQPGRGRGDHRLGVAHPARPGDRF